MKRLITYFSTRKALSPENGPTLARLWSEINPFISRKLFVCLFCLLSIGVGRMWGYTGTFTKYTTSTLIDGYYVIGASESSSNSSYCAGTTVSSGRITGTTLDTSDPANNIVWIIENTASGWTFNSYGSSTKYIKQTSTTSGKGMAINTAIGYFTLVGYNSSSPKGFKFSSADQNSTNQLKWNNSNKWFSNYANAYDVGMAPVTLYRDNSKYRAKTTQPASGSFTASATGATWDGTKKHLSWMASGTTVTLTATPPSGMAVDTWTVTKASGGTVTVTNNQFTMPADQVTITVTWKSSGTSVSLSKGATTNGSFSLSTSSVTTTSSAQTVTVTCTPDAGYYVSAISATNPATCPSAITYGGSNNSRTVTYPTGANGSSTISVTFSPIWELSYGVWGGSWGDPVTMTVADGVASCTLSLSAMTKYGFKFHNAQTNTWYGNSGGVVITDISNWEFPTDGMNCRLFTGPSGNYTFSWTIASSRGAVSYPSVSHPSTGYAYFKKQGSDTYIKVYTHHNSSACEVADWEGSVQVNNIANICNNDYFYFALTDAGGCSKAIIRYNNASSQQGDFTITSHPYSGKWASVDDTNWHEFTTYTISYDKGTGTGGSMSSHTDLCPGSNQALSANAFTKDHYHFTGWTANVDVKIGGSTVTAGTLITGTPTIQNVQSNITLTAQWEVNSNTLTWNWGGGSTTSTTYTLYPATSGSVNYNAAITKPANGTMSKTGYTFSSWSSNATTMPDEDLTITAQWTAKTYNNTLEREGGTTGSTSVTTTYNSSTLTGYTAPGKTGYTFGGYWSGDDGTGTEVIGTNGALKASVTISAVAWTNSSSQWVKDGAVTMYAKWTAKNYTVTLNDGSGSGGSGSKGVTYNANTNLTTNVAVPTYAGNDFRGYYTSTGGSGTKVIDGNGAWIRGTAYVDASGNWVYDGSPTLHAYYTAYEYENYRTNCSDMYDIVLDDGLVATTNNGSAKVAANGTTLTSIVAPTKSGYDVEGYYTTSGLATKIATDAGALQNGSGSGITVGGNAWTNSSSQWVRGAGETFYTKWTAHNYTITYEGLEGATNTNPTSYTIETTTIVLANPGSRTGYTFTGWTCGGAPITSITIGSTGDKTITATWSINTPNLAVSAADHVVITATPASESAIAEGANRNVNYNKTVTLNCTPDEHWNLTWDVYKTGESSTKVALTGSGDGATFTMPDYAVTVAAVMTEDTYHTATFKNNGVAIDGYDGVKTYDGTCPSAPTLTDITDACDKTDCNKFYGWIAEGDIWTKTINSVAGKTIYRNASSIPVVDGADVVYHAVWAKGTGVNPTLPNTIVYWAKTAFDGANGVSATTGTGTLTSNVSLSTESNRTFQSSISQAATMTITGIDISSYEHVRLSFWARGSAGGTISIKTNLSATPIATTSALTGDEVLYVVDNVPNTATSITMTYSASSGSFFFGTVKLVDINTSDTYSFTELNSENTSGWAGSNWDGYYLITNAQASLKALDGNAIGPTSYISVSPSDGVITNGILNAFKVEYNSTEEKFSVQGIGDGTYINYINKSVGYASSAQYHTTIGYNALNNAADKLLSWNSSGSKFGFYGTIQTSAPKMYKILDSYTEFRITCCDNTVTIGTPDKTGSGTVTFESGGDAYAAGDKVETCEGETTITATVTPTNGYQCTALGFSGGSVSVSPAIPEPFVPYTAATAYTLTFDQNTNATLATTVTFTALVDHYIDNMHYNTTQNKSGNYGTAPTLSDESKGEQCTGLHYKFIGWIPESDMNMDTGVPTTTANMVAGGATGKYATGTNYYAIWAEEE